ncbi:MAG: bifunctional UDP-N-acetylglucosamine diphosphorylase/glucosamine-1-phosphate N-acetyltransferase GlmU [Rubrivivax sp.]|nr:bifunctional UDP-N-acetylglucosamine diphosphorylase/glucosamine-1-phosphate N-acetyltransferase GlmU [Rubrivivax sp.]
MALNVVIMAAGKGTRMKSAIPKVLHRIAGTSLLDHVMRTALALEPGRTVVLVGHGAPQVEASIAGRGARCVLQEPQLGTGHAMQVAAPVLDDALATTLVLYGDVPLLRAETARALVAASGGQRVALLSFKPADTARYGRIVRDAAGQVRAIVEYKDANDEQRAIREVYSGIMAAPTRLLRRWVAALKNDNAQGEYYLTDIVAMAVAEGVPVVAEAVADEAEVAGINDAAQLAELERVFQRRQAQALMTAGVRLADPARLDVRGTLTCGQDVEIDVGCVFEGTVHLADGARIGPHCMIRDATIGERAQIQAFTHIREAVVGARAEVGPYARLRPGAELGEEVHIGNFVEVKNSTLAAGAKANHLAYLGDATVGARVNYGAGSITANYDGANKHRTVIGDDAHIGSNCVLVAPITIGAGATIGGGSTINKPAPAGKLTLARTKAVTLDGWHRPKKVPKAG